MPNIGVWEILILLLVLLLIFGPKRLPGMGRSLGRGMREFKESVTDQTRELKEAVGETPSEFKRAVNPLEPIEPKPDQVVGDVPATAPPAGAAGTPAEPPTQGEGEPVSR